MQLISILLSAGGGSPEGGGGMMNLVMISLIFVVFYFFMIRPQQKKMKEANKFRDEIKKGQRIVTTSGIHGKIVEISDAFFMVDMGGVKVKMDKSAISLESTHAAYANDKEVKETKEVEA